MQYNVMVWYPINVGQEAWGRIIQLQLVMIPLTLVVTVPMLSLSLMPLKVVVVELVSLTLV